MSLDVILVLGAFLAAMLSGVAGFGGALLLLPLLTHRVGVTDAVPLLTVAQLVGNLARVGFGFREIAWPPVLLFSAFALPAAVLGAFSFVAVPGGFAIRMIGLAILLFVVVRQTGIWRGEPGRATMATGAIAVGFLSGLVGSAGPLGAALFLSLGLAPAAYIASEALAALAIHAAKLVVYGQTLSFAPGFWALAAALSAAMVAGTFAARRIVGQLDRATFERWVGILLAIIAVQMIVMG